MEELKVPTRAVRVDVFLRDGTDATGWMYHRESLYETGSPSDIFSDLNDDRDFLPFEADNETLSLLNKRHITRIVVHELGIEQLGPDGVTRYEELPVSTLLFDNGSRLDGRLVLETPGDSSRLVDKFNQAPTFVPFVFDDGVGLVNGARIVQIFYND